MAKKGPQAYRGKEDGVIYKLESITNNEFVVHLQDGPERIPVYWVKKLYEYIGPWREVESSEGGVHQNS